MRGEALTEAGIREAYRAAHPRCAALHGRARRVIPGGITHDIRYLVPFPISVQRAAGARKWDLDGQELVDYWMGHGALLLGHGAPEVLRAVEEQLLRGTHYGASHELEVQWAEWIARLLPSAERVRFTASGTEATQLALRLARAFTGREKVLKLEGHFHGWHDYAVSGVRPPYATPVSRGVPRGTIDQVLLCPPNDLKALANLVESRDDIAALLLEPAGGTSGTIPTTPGFLQGVREITRAHKVLLIFDEVITGFRYAPGGAQAVYGVSPDLTTLAKIMAGGFPGGAVVGKAEILDLLAFGDDPEWNRFRKVSHAGTFNGNPLVAAAGIATLTLLADGEVQKRAAAAAGILRQRIGSAIRRLGVDAHVYGESSIVNYLLEPRRYGVQCEGPLDRFHPQAALTGEAMGLYHTFRCALILHGADMPPLHGWVSAAHGEADLEKTVTAVSSALEMLQKAGRLS